MFFPAVDGTSSLLLSLIVEDRGFFLLADTLFGVCNWGGSYLTLSSFSSLKLQCFFVLEFSGLSTSTSNSLMRDACGFGISFSSLLLVDYSVGILGLYWRLYASGTWLEACTWGGFRGDPLTVAQTVGLTGERGSSGCEDLNWSIVVEACLIGLSSSFQSSFVMSSRAGSVC